MKHFSIPAQFNFRGKGKSKLSKNRIAEGASRTHFSGMEHPNATDGTSLPDPEKIPIHIPAGLYDLAW